MRYSTKQYAATLVSALAGKSEKDEKKIIANFFSLLKRNGDFVKRREIFKEIERVVRKSDGVRKVVLETTVPVSEEVKKEIEKNLGSKAIFEENINPSVIGGMKILVDDEYLIDATVKRQLDKLFSKKTLTTIN